MDSDKRLMLQKMIKEYNAEDTTSQIRKLKHSVKIREDVGKLISLNEKYSRLDKDTKRKIIEKQCFFLYENYTNIFNRLMKKQLDLTILDQFLNVLRDIENGKYDQHEGSVKVGELLKKLYIDSALREKNQIEEKDKKARKKMKTKEKKGKKISWSQYKNLPNAS
tara:strand:- start:176 stop:670 length:495 start_codon:yes stop_codon:yes gene_type:complete